MAAPVCLSIVGALNLIAASAQDFQLYSDQKTEFQFLKWPNSYKASLYQVSFFIKNNYENNPNAVDFLSSNSMFKI